MENELKLLLIEQFNNMLKNSLTQEFMLESLSQEQNQNEFIKIKENLSHLLKTNQNSYSELIEIIKEL